MRNFQQKIGWRDIIESKPFLILFALLLLFFAWNVFIFWNKMKETAKNREIVEDKVMSLRLQKEKLSSDIDSLATEEGKERLFRENFGLAKEGEGMVVVVEDKNLLAAPIQSNTGGFFSFLKNWFK